MKPIDVMFKDSSDPKGIRMAYIMGYRTGYEDGRKDRPDMTRISYDKEIALCMPIEVMKLSTHAHRCMANAGCRYVSDVAKMTAERIRTLRNVGKGTAKEVVQALKEFGISDTEWEYAWKIEW